MTAAVQRQTGTQGLTGRLEAQLRDRLAAASNLPPWAASLQQAAALDFERNGLPSVRVEAWKYTSLRDLERGLAGLGRPGEALELPVSSLDVQASCRVVMTDGAYSGQESTLGDGVELKSLDDALAEGVEGIEDMLAALETTHPAQALSALNNATLGAGLVIRVPAGTDAGRLLLQWHSSAAADEGLFNSRVCVLLEPGARLELVEHHVAREGAAPAPVALSEVVQARLGRSARLRHGRLQETDRAATLFTRTEVEQFADSRYEATGLDLGGALVRHDIRARLLEPGATIALNGAYLPSGDSHVDVHLAVDHEARDCSSSQFYRGVLDDRGRAVFNGRVHVLPGADGTEARQSNANLLLSSDAEIDTKPELEIEADEVVASHGATVGQLDEGAVFYLRSRGIDEAAARQMLTGAFCRAVIERLPEGPVRDAFAVSLEAALERSA